MRWAITGTPGTGKTTVGSRLDLDRPIVHIHDLLADDRFIAGEDPSRDTTIVDLDALSAWVADQPTNVIIESHLAHHLPVDRAIVLRCHPEELCQRLEARNTASIEENVESERLDLILVEAIDRIGSDAVFEIDTTGRSIQEIVTDVEATIRGETAPRAGIVSFLDES